jgi:hypothetical protein
MKSYDSDGLNEYLHHPELQYSIMSQGIAMKFYSRALDLGTLLKSFFHFSFFIIFFSILLHSNHYATMPNELNYSQVPVYPAREPQTFEYPQAAAPIQRCSRSLRYPHPKPGVYICGDIPVLNFTDPESRISFEVKMRVSRIWRDAWRLWEEEGHEPGKDVVYTDIMEMGTDLRGRRKLEKIYRGLSDEARIAREVHLARYSGFRLRKEDLSLDYGTGTPQKGAKMKGIEGKKKGGCGIM